MTQIANETEIRRLWLRKYSTWRVLFLYEAGRLTQLAAAELLSIDPENLDWIRAVALTDGRNNKETP